MLWRNSRLFQGKRQIASFLILFFFLGVSFFSMHDGMLPLQFLPSAEEI
jgi:hypothetical protein